MQPEKTLVIFDIDGTLLYSNRIDSQCFASTYEHIYEVEFPSIDWRNYPHVSDTTIFAHLIDQHFNRPVDPAEVDYFQDHYVGLLEEKRRANPDDFLQVPGARDTVHRLVDEGYRVGIATGGWRRPGMVKLGHIGIKTDALTMSFADGKPTREDIIQEVLDHPRVQGSEHVVYIGDAIWDVTTTRNMQLPFVGVRRTGDFDVLREAGADHLMMDYRDYDHFKSLIHSANPPRVVKPVTN